MGPLATGQVVTVFFPFFDLTASKLRPAVVLAESGRGDWILCQITSKPYGDPTAVCLEPSDFAHGSLRLTSYARPAKLFTAHRSLISSQVGELKPGRFNTIRDAVIRIIQRS